MYDYSKRVSKFHSDCVRLSRDQQSDMRNRRQTNLERIEKGLEELEKPPVVETINQGGDAQKTMTQPPESDQESRYDIDLGVVFDEEDAAGPRTTRMWVRDAIARKASNLKNEPEIKKKCVRVIYSDGYQCDFPVFRRSVTDSGWTYELSSGDEWVASDPRAMNTWIDDQVMTKSPEDSGSYQLRRVIRMGKFFAKTHDKRLRRKFPGGLVATAIFIEAYVPVEDRDDESFRETLRAISVRSEDSPVYANGVQVSDDKDEDRIGRLIEEARVSVEQLDKLDAYGVAESDASKYWKKVFCHSFFGTEAKEVSGSAFSSLETKGALGSAGLAAPLVASRAAAALSESERLQRMESAVQSRKESGGGGKPWSD